MKILLLVYNSYLTREELDAKNVLYPSCAGQVFLVSNSFTCLVIRKWLSCSSTATPSSDASVVVSTALHSPDSLTLLIKLPTLRKSPPSPAKASSPENLSSFWKIAFK